MAHIVVGIPALDDDDLPETVAHLYALSSRRHDITVVVHEQVSEHGRIDTAKLPGFDAKRHNYRYIHSARALGCWPARRGISTYLKAEGLAGDYGLAIDAHMRFRSDWDDTVVGLHSAARGREWLGRPTADAVLTGGMHYDLWGDAYDGMPMTLYTGDWTFGGFMPYTECRLFERRTDLVPARHCGGGTTFGPFELLHLWQRHGDNILFMGEERVLGLEVFRAGWGLWHAQLPYAHLGLRPGGRPTGWDADPDWAERNARSLAYQRQVLHADLASCSKACDTGRPVCDVEEYQQLIGMDYRARRELRPNAWSEWIERHYPEALRV